MSTRPSSRRPYRTVLGYVLSDGEVVVREFWDWSAAEGRERILIAKRHGWSRVYEQPRRPDADDEAGLDDWEDLSGVGQAPAVEGSEFYVYDWKVDVAERHREAQERAKNPGMSDEEFDHQVVGRWKRQARDDLVGNWVIGIGVVVLIVWLFASAVSDARQATELCVDQLVSEEGISPQEAREQCAVRHDDIDRGDWLPGT